MVQKMGMTSPIPFFDGLMGDANESAWKLSMIRFRKGFKILVSKVGD